MNPDGTMAKGEDIRRFSLEHGFPVITIGDLIHLRC
jgi:3,4-dihydroxy 2-butanone 4-phosphate synthase